MSKRSSPRKDDPSAERSAEPVVTTSGTKLKLRLKVNEATSTFSATDTSTTNTSTANTSTTTNPPAASSQSPSLGPKIKLNFSRSNESVIEAPVTAAAKGKRGRPKKDKSAVKAAALAASQPNEAESEERRSRRRAAEEKIKRSNDPIVTIVNVATNIQEGDGAEKDSRKRGRTDTNEKRRRRHTAANPAHSSSSSSTDSIGKKNSSEFVEITDNQSNTPNQIANPTTSSSFNPHENEFIQRSKTFLNISLQHDTFMYTGALSNPLEVDRFRSIEDAVEKLGAFHVGIGAGQFKNEELEGADVQISEKFAVHADNFEMLQDRYRSILHAHASKKVPTELLLLEQRLCLEEEKFLLVKLKNEYATKFLRGPSSSSLASSATSSMASSLASVSSSGSRPSTPGSLGK